MAAHRRPPTHFSFPRDYRAKRIDHWRIVQHLPSAARCYRSASPRRALAFGSRRRSLGHLLFSSPAPALARVWPAASCLVFVCPASPRRVPVGAGVAAVRRCPLLRADGGPCGVPRPSLPWSSRSRSPLRSTHGSDNRVLWLRSSGDKATPLKRGVALSAGRTQPKPVIGPVCGAEWGPSREEVGLPLQGTSFAPPGRAARPLLTPPGLRSVPAWGRVRERQDTFRGLLLCSEVVRSLLRRGIPP